VKQRGDSSRCSPPTLKDERFFKTFVLNCSINDGDSLVLPTGIPGHIAGTV